MDAKASAQFLHVEVFKISIIIYEYGRWDAEVANNVVKDELGDLNSSS